MQRLFVFFICVNLLFAANAQIGSLDNSFAGKGYVLTDIPESLNAQFYASAIQADGKLVVGGSINVGNGNEFFLQRYNQDGTLDQAFGAGGTVTTHFPIPWSDLSDLSILPGGKILAAGRLLDLNFSGGSSGSREHVAVVRYNTNGTVDESFADNGFFNWSIGDSEIEIGRMVIQPDQKIVLAGHKYVGQSDDNRYDFILIRLNANGSIDESFGEAGIVLTDFNPEVNDPEVIGDMVLQCDGKIVVVGTVGLNIGVARYHSDGSLDNSFGTGGKTTVDIQSTEDAGRAIAVVDNGKFVIGGYTRAEFYEFALVKLNANGTIDESFGQHGKVHTDFGPFNDRISSLAIRDGKIIVGGSTDITNREFRQDVNFALARYNSNGTLDETFGNGGKVSNDFSSGSGLVADDRVLDLSMDENNLFAVGASGFWQSKDSVILKGTVAAYLLEPMKECNNPQISNLTATPNELWPPNHKMVDVRVDYDLNSSCFPCNNCVLSISSDEESENDWEIIDNHHVRLKAERSGKGNGRVYTINVTCTEISGNQSTGSTTVKVLENMSLKSEKQKIGKDVFLVGSPNPSKNHFNLQLQSNSTLSYELKITDVLGRVVEAKNSIMPFETIRIGDNYKPGIYYAIAIQGERTTVIRLLKAK